MIESQSSKYSEEESQAAAELLRALRRPAAPSIEKERELADRFAALALGASSAPTPAGWSLWAKAVCGVGVVSAVALGIWRFGSPGPSGAAQDAQPKVAVLEQEIPGVVVPEVALAPSAAPSPPPAQAPSAVAKKNLALDPLREEESILERARSSADPRTALGLLQQHERRFPKGQLALERMYMIVGVLDRLGRTEAATKQADKIVRLYPHSTYATQLVKRKATP